jgi:hypothetical protein
MMNVVDEQAERDQTARLDVDQVKNAMLIDGSQPSEEDIAIRKEILSKMNV